MFCFDLCLFTSVCQCVWILANLAEFTSARVLKFSCQTKMTSTTEDQNTGAYHSQGSLQNPRNGKIKRASSSEPFIKPNLSFSKLADQLLEKIFSHLNVKESHDHSQQRDFSIDESKYVLRELATELDGVLQLKDVTILSGVENCEIKEEEGQTVILLWADEMRSQQQKRKQEMQAQAELQAPYQQAQINKRIKEAKTTLCDWAWKLKNMPKESVSLRGEYKAVLQDLYKQWKKGQLVNILPIMDFVIRYMLQENKSEESLLKQWSKSEQTFRKAGGVHVPISVWNWITRLSANVTLDPDTANPSLLLSQDGKTVRTKNHKESLSITLNDLQRRRIKFDGWTCVQAVDGYITGRHYWEVDIKGKYEWRIGVVKESAPRQGYVNMNTTTGYWTLRLQLGSLMALTDPVTKLNQPTPSKIGVYLDIEEGKVSFYDSERRRHIYTFKTHFSKPERIYPVFGTVETDRALRII